MRIVIVIGARPNFVKVGPLIPRLQADGHEVDLVFTGSRRQSRQEPPARPPSFHGVEVPMPKWFLDVGEDTDASETGRALVEHESLLAREMPDSVLAIGDVNPTLATVIAAAKLGIPVIHLEAGLRCGMMQCPGEVNRALITRVTSLHLAPTEEAVLNLMKDGIAEERIQFVGSMMAESVLRHLDGIKGSATAARYGVKTGEYALLSMHQRGNTRSPEFMRVLIEATDRTGLQVVFPDGRDVCEEIAALDVDLPSHWHCLEPVQYVDMLGLEREAAVVVTDSGGVQEEACMLDTPCVTLGDHTEHGATVDVGANRLAYGPSSVIADAIRTAVGSKRGWVTPKRWDRAVSDRIVRAIRRGVRPL